MHKQGHQRRLANTAVTIEKLSRTRSPAASCIPSLINIGGFWLSARCSKRIAITQLQASHLQVLSGNKRCSEDCKRSDTSSPPPDLAQARSKIISAAWCTMVLGEITKVRTFFRARAGSWNLLLLDWTTHQAALNSRCPYHRRSSVPNKI
jgi:hypothetical protein